jgi:hypothetical protein
LWKYELQTIWKNIPRIGVAASFLHRAIQHGVKNQRFKMKLKTKRKTSGNKTLINSPVAHQQLDSIHLRELHDFVNHIMCYAENPANWPLSQQEQIAFVRTVIFQARKLRNSEGYVTAGLILAREDLAMAS